MKFRAPNAWLVVLWAALPVLSYFFSKNGSAVGFVLQNRTTLLSLYSILIAGPLWVAYGRLNGLDASEGLKPSQSLIVSEFALVAKSLLVRKFLFSVICVFLATLVISAEPHIPGVDGRLSAVAVAAVLVYFVHAVVSICSALLQIEKTLKSVNKWKAEQKERGKQVADLKKARTERKLIPDEKLLVYRELAIEVADPTPERARENANPDIKGGAT